MKVALEAVGLARSAAEEVRGARVVVLTPGGRQLLARLKRRTFPLIDAAVREACGDNSGRFLAQLDTLEKALDDVPLVARTIRLATGVSPTCMSWTVPSGPH